MSMDEQTTPSTEPINTTPEPVNPPAGEADAPISAVKPDGLAVEEPQTDSLQPQAKPDPAPETPQIEPLSELLPATAETPTPQLPADEALPESTPELAPQGADLIRADEDAQEAPAEAPKVETPTPPPAPTINADASEETHIQTEESPQTPPQTQQGTAQPEPTPTPASPMPAQAPTETPQNILMLLLTKARLVTQLRKHKKLLKIMNLFAKKKSITNDDVEKLLHVSDATALRYLTQLKNENKIVQIGKTGQGVTYTKR